MKYKFSLREKVLVGLCMVVVVGFIANRQMPRTLTYIHFNKNPLLNDEQKEYAKRYYDFSMKHPGRSIMPLDISEYKFDSDLYKKWGLGKRRLFTKPEKQYILKLEGIENLWMTYEKEYKSIDLNNLSKSEAAYLKKIHDKYGDKPVDLIKEIRDDEGDFFKENVELYEHCLPFLSEVFGFKKTDDLVIIFLHRLEQKAII